MITFANFSKHPFSETKISPEKIEKHNRLSIRNSWRQTMLIPVVLSMNLLFLKAQDFIYWSSIVLPEVYNSSVAWGDYDNDGDLDILITGNTDTSRVSKIYRNDGGNTFNEQTGISLTGVDCSSVAWGDYDNDGDLDILLTGNTGSECISKIYKNNGNNTFTVQGISLTGICCGSAAWGDSDNDGHLDILLTGNTSGSPISKIYKNNGDNSFTEQTQIALVEYYDGSVAWGDYDIDGDLDILLAVAGTSSIYKNYGSNVFALQTGISLAAGNHPTVVWGDYDNNGYLDILLAEDPGGGSSTAFSKIYKNNGPDEPGFTEQTEIGLTGVDYSSLAWGDYNNDGYTDILLTGGYRLSPYVSGITAEIYKNNGGNSFQLEISLTGVNQSSVAWGDYDNDGDLDILLTGNSAESGYDPVSKIYKNNGSTLNTVPGAPSDLSSLVSDNDVTINWNKASDNETPADGLTYNVHLYLHNGDTIMSSMSDINSGYRRIPAMGNVQHDTTWTVKNLESGKYIWSVQAVDHAFAGSPFTVTDTFIIPTPSPAASNQVVCYGGPIPDLIATGETIKWYSDIELQNLVHTGSPFATGETDPGVYTFWVTQTLNGYESQATMVTLSIPGPYTGEQICIVTVDPETGKNLVVWEKTPEVGIAYYNIYRESQAVGIYDLIGNRPNNELSVFTDTVADPETKPYLYKITVVDTCGNESPLENSLSHKPIFLQYVSSVGGINLEWSGYEIEGIPLDFVNYTIYRGSDSTLLSPLQENIPPWINVYTDTDPTALTERYYYRVAGVLTDLCSPTGDLKAGSGPYSHSMSNMEDNRIMAPVENQAPTDLALDNLSIDENEPAGSLVGRLTTTDPDIGDTHYYSLVTGIGDNDNSNFTISGDSLLTATTFDYETRNTYSIRISTTDTGYLSFEKQLTILINDVSDPAVLNGSITGSSNISCYGLNDGTATVSASGGTSPFTYLWDDEAASTAATVTDLFAGQWYRVTVTDQSMQSAMDSVILSEPDPVDISKDYTAEICQASNDGYIHLDVTGGIPPYSFNWLTGETSQEINNLAAGKYQVTITDANGCIAIDSTLIDSIVPYQGEEICMVTVNSQNQIIIIWEKTHGKGTAYYNLYRRQSGNTYALIDSVGFNNISIYVDESALPQEQSFYYKIAAVDSCGQESGLSPYHKSIHMWTAVGVNGEVTLNWNNYEGYQYFDFEIFRGTNQTQVTSVRIITSDARSWTDPNIPTGRIYYQVSAVKGSPCFPTQFKSDPVFESARSNLDDNGITGVPDQSMIENLTIYPNPFNEITTIRFDNPEGSKYMLYVTDLTGKVVYYQENIFTNQIEFTRDGIPEGCYFVELRGPNIWREKIIIE